MNPPLVAATLITFLVKFSSPEFAPRLFKQTEGLIHLSLNPLGFLMLCPLEADVGYDVTYHGSPPW